MTDNSKVSVFSEEEMYSDRDIISSNTGRRAKIMLEKKPPYHIILRITEIQSNNKKIFKFFNLPPLANHNPWSINWKIEYDIILTFSIFFNYD